MDSSGGNQGTRPGRAEIEVEEDPRYVAAMWRAERVAWVGMALILLAALVGLFGNGPVSRRTAGDPEGPLSIAYERFIRHDAPAVLKIRVGPDLADAGGRVRLWVNRAYLGGVRIERITPEPERAEAAGDRIVFIFPAAEPSQPLLVRMEFQSESIGSIRGAAGVEAPAAPRVEFSQFAYP